MSNGPDHRLYEFFGVELGEPNGSNQYVTDCPFCDKERHFYINAETSLYQCKDGSCAAEGNPYTFIETLYQQALASSNPFSYRRLAHRRKKFHVDAFIKSGIAWSNNLSCWLVPDRNTASSITNLSKYTGDPNSPCYGAPGCSQHLWGLEDCKPEGPIYICEGRWDAIALRWLLNKINPDGDWTVLGAPGASNMPKADLVHLQGRNVYLLYDNDDAGKNGMKVVTPKLTPIVNTLHLLAWPLERFPDKYDLEDYIRESTDRHKTTFDNLLSWCFRYQKGADPTEIAPKLIRNTLEEVLDDYQETGIHMYSGLTDFLILTLAVIYSNKLQGEPLWLYGIGDPGRGKSLILESTLGSPSCVYRTSVTYRSFLTGMRNEGTDNSLLNVIPGKALIVKDYSNVLSLPHLEQDQLVSLLREAYDGKVCRTYGNHLYREYPPSDSPFRDCRFSFVAGVTKEIHARSHAGLGERFLKYEIPCSEADSMKAMLAALDDSWKTHERQIHRASAVAAFLDRPITTENLPTIPGWFCSQIISLSQFVGLCRSSVSRTKGDLDFDPSAESGTRLCKQLKKLAQSLCFVLNLKEANEEVYRLIRKVAWDTAHGWRRNLFLHLFHEEEVATSVAIAEGVGFSLGTTHRQLQDMRALKIASSRKDVLDQHKYVWALTPKSREIISSARLDEV